MIIISILLTFLALLGSNFGAGLVEAKATDDDFDFTKMDPVNILLFMFFGLCLGIIVTQLLARFDKSENVPYTVVIFVIGAIISQTPRTESSGAFLESVQSWIHIDAELILFVFLPPLIFGEVSNIISLSFLLSIVLFYLFIIIFSIFVFMFCMDVIGYEPELASCKRSLLSRPCSSWVSKLYLLLLLLHKIL